MKKTRSVNDISTNCFQQRSEERDTIYSVRLIKVTNAKKRISYEKALIGHMRRLK